MLGATLRMPGCHCCMADGAACAASLRWPASHWGSSRTDRSLGELAAICSGCLPSGRGSRPPCMVDRTTHQMKDTPAAARARVCLSMHTCDDALACLPHRNARNARKATDESAPSAARSASHQLWVRLQLASRALPSRRRGSAPKGTRR